MYIDNGLYLMKYFNFLTVHLHFKTLTALHKIIYELNSSMQAT